MTRDDIIRMAREAGLCIDGEVAFSPNHDGQDVDIADLQTFAKLVAAAERDACAKVCLDVLKKWQESGDSSEYTRPDALDCADAICERGQE